MKFGVPSVLILQGSFVNIKDVDSWRKTVRTLRLKIPAFQKKLDDTGVVLLSPKRIRKRMTDIGSLIGELQKRIEAKKDVFEVSKNLENQLYELSRDARKILGTLDL